MDANDDSHRLRLLEKKVHRLIGYVAGAVILGSGYIVGSIAQSWGGSLVSGVAALMAVAFTWWLMRQEFWR